MEVIGFRITKVMVKKELQDAKASEVTDIHAAV